MHLRASRDPLFISDFSWTFFLPSLLVFLLTQRLSVCFCLGGVSRCCLQKGSCADVPPPAAPRVCASACSMPRAAVAALTRVGTAFFFPRSFHLCCFLPLTSVLLLFILLSFPHGAQAGGSSWYLLTGTTFLRDQILDKGQVQCFQVIGVRHSGCCRRG